MRKRLLSVMVFAAVGAALCTTSFAQQRTEIPFPNPPGYVTLRCDLHTHPVYSDGEVWPTVRVKEAWRNGLDAISITDHIEYLPHKDDIRIDFNRSYEIARGEADKLGVILIRGAEITRDEPHGHFNAVFTQDNTALDVEDQRDAVRIANEQGAFVFWNHPEWKRTGYDVWGDIQSDYLQSGWMKGIEVFNGVTYYENAHRWAVEKNLTILANTDVHGPIGDSYDAGKGVIRTLTLVFAAERSEDAIQDALLARRTVGFSRDVLVGEDQWARPLFEGAVQVMQPSVTLRSKGERLVPVHNACAAGFDLAAAGQVDGLTFPQSVRLPAGQTAMLRLKGDGSVASGTKNVALPYTVKNVWIAPGEGLPVTLNVEVTFSE